MSTQPSPSVILSPQLPGGDDLVFGDNPQSSLAIPKALLAKLSEHVNQGVRKLSPGGLEVGGLLVGPKVRGGRVVVAGIIPLHIEYEFGPCFQMSEFDLSNMAAAIESVQSDPSSAVVGFYRGRRVDSRMLRDSDHEIFAAVEAVHNSFAEDFRCCFILEPIAEFEALACIAMRNGNAWDEMQPYTLGLNLPSITSFPASTVLPHLTRDVHAANHSSIRPARNWMYVIAGILAIWTAGLYLSGGKEPSRSFPTAPAKAVPRLEFSAIFESPVWRLSWNRAAMDALKPVRAVLSIQDGAVQQEVPFTASDLSSGTAFYTPQGGDLNFGLRVDRGGSFVEEHVRVLGAPGAAQKPIPAASVPNIAAAAAPPAPAKPKPISVPRATPSTPEREVKSLPAPVLPQTAMAIPIPVPPVIDPPRVVVPPPAPRTQPATQPLKQAAGPTSKRVPSRATARASAPAKSNYVGPRPIQKVSPQMPANSSYVSQVQVLVDIDVRGKVTKVTPLARNARNAPVMAVAVRAASSWLFEPAQLNGHAVPSKLTLTFRSNPLRL